MELGNRMKQYEKVSNVKLTRRTPVIVRVDGRSFHSFTRGLDKPFDMRFIWVMQDVAIDLMKLSGNCVLAYVQSDEISILMKDWSGLDTEPFFDNKIQKIASIFSAAATSSFINNWFVSGNNDDNNLVDIQLDARCFNIPKEEVCNYFVWRQQNWTRNSIQMLGRSKFSQKQMQGKNCNEIQEMLWTKYNINWDGLDNYLKRGTFVYRDNEIIIDYNCPILTQNRDYVDKYLDEVEEDI